MKPRIRVKMRKGAFIKVGGFAESMYGHGEALKSALRCIFSKSKIHDVRQVNKDGDYTRYWVVYGG